MNTFAIFFVVLQACLLQTIYGQCQRGVYAPAVAAPVSAGPLWNAVASAIGSPLTAGYGLGGDCGYGGVGVGNVAVAGELPVAGTTIVAGQVPILGAVEFCGTAGAAGSVSITGSCGCGCGNYF